ncbi:MAG: hypothetical protein RBQ65_06190 [Sphaerochaeta sp.]|jgi:hypothetical protein|nr:hypothetical protein [Sphaerochaeta sp.]
MKFRTILLIVALLSLSALLFGAGFSDTVVLHLYAYIPERTTFFEYEGAIFVESNAHNFTYTMTSQGFDRMVAVIAN